MNQVIRQILDNHAKNYVKKDGSQKQLMTLPVETFLKWFNSSTDEDSNKNTVPTLSQAISDYAKQHHGVNDVDIAEHEEALRRSVNTWARRSEYELFREIKEITGLNLLGSSSFAFMDKLDHIYDLHPDYYYVQEKLYSECGVSSEVSQTLCKDMDSYFNDKNKYLTICQILDSHGLEGLAYSWFLHWIERTKAYEYDYEKSCKYIHDQLNNEFGLSYEQTELLVNDMVASGYFSE